MALFACFLKLVWGLGLPAAVFSRLDCFLGVLLDIRGVHSVQNKPRVLHSKYPNQLFFLGLPRFLFSC